MRRLALALALAGCSHAEGAALPAEAGPAPAESSAAAAEAAKPAKPAEPACEHTCFGIERCEHGKCVPNCPAGEVYVPATGPEGFVMGHGDRHAFDQRHTVVLTKPFCMDETEVTVRAYRACVEAGDCTLPQLLDANSNYRPEFKHDDHPLNMVNWMQATQYCKAQGKALPTEAQFEWAAGHGDGRRYPWGNETPHCQSGHADFTPGGTPKVDPAGDHGCHGGNTSPVKAHPNGKSSWPAGDIHDLGGNVWEWTADCYAAYPAEKQVDPSPQHNPKLRGDCYVRALRGGGWNRSKEAMHPWWRAGSKRTYRVPGLGFRCVRNPS